MKWERYWAGGRILRWERYWVGGRVKGHCVKVLRWERYWAGGRAKGHCVKVLRWKRYWVGGRIKRHCVHLNVWNRLVVQRRVFLYTHYHSHFLCIVQIKLLQICSQGHSQLCYSTDAESPKYCCTPYSQSTTPSKLQTSPTATSLAPNFWTNNIQNCLHVLQRNHRFRTLLSFWVYYAFTVLPAPSALRQTHACLNSNASTVKPMAFSLSHTSAPTSGKTSPNLPTLSATFSSFKRFYRCFINKDGWNYPEFAAEFRVAGHMQGTETPPLLLDYNPWRNNGFVWPNCGFNVSTYQGIELSEWISQALLEHNSGVNDHNWCW